MYSTRILKDSIAPCGKRLTTWELTYPRFVHAELMTHRMFSRNSASSRAIPTEKMLARIREDPALPQFWGKNQSGMQAAEALDGTTQKEAERLWLEARDQMLAAVEALGKLGLHKQLANRLIEPWMFITVIVSATEFANWFHLRNHRAAQPEIAWVASSMWSKYNEAKPRYLGSGAWHLPLFDEGLGSDGEWPLVDYDEAKAKKISTGRCARVSYLTHEGVRDLLKDIELHDKLCSGPSTGDPGHWSPFEHVARAMEEPVRVGNFIGWFQYRKQFPAEHFGGPMP
jgi:thymidylate synthase ThyX